MGLFKSIKKAAKQTQKTFKKAGKQFTQNARNAQSTFAAIGTYAAAPVSIAAESVGAGLRSAAPVLGQATQILQDNPLLGQALGSMVPGLGGLFSGAGAAPSDGGGAVVLPSSTDDRPRLPVWVWIAGGGAALLGLVLILKRKA